MFAKSLIFIFGAVRANAPCPMMLQNSMCNPLYTGGLFLCCMLDEFNYHLGMSRLFYLFMMEAFNSKHCRP